ncbi:blue light sensor protein [Aquicoccus sp. SCR17]|nr:blue light sensor protein [Carideicomes alvinocaridis]
MPLFTLSYLSVACADLIQPDLLDLTIRSQARNHMNDITGLLFHDGVHFLQTLEGPRDAVIEIFGDITQDARHSFILPFAVTEIDQRRFDGWSLRYFSSEMTREIASDLGEADLSRLELLDLHQAALDLGSN